MVTLDGKILEVMDKLWRDSRPRAGFALVQVLVVILVLVGVGAVGVYLVKNQGSEVGLTNLGMNKPLTLTLESPKEGDVAVNNEVLVKGKTSPGAVVMIYTEGDETSVDADSAGNFESTVLLETGVNTLTVTAYSTSGEEKSVSVYVVHDNES